MSTARTAVPTISDRMGILYLDHAKIHTHENCVAATLSECTLRIPTATLTALFLGPGTSTPSSRIHPHGKPSRLKPSHSPRTTSSRLLAHDDRQFTPRTRGSIEDTLARVAPDPVHPAHAGIDHWATARAGLVLTFAPRTLGIDRRSPAGPSRCWGSPRARGDRSEDRRYRSAARRFAPRTRGSIDGPGDRRPDGCFHPAYAGIDQCAAAPDSTPTVHPACAGSTTNQCR